jgi:hypothetical protein
LGFHGQKNPCAELGARAACMLLGDRIRTPDKERATSDGVCKLQSDPRALRLVNLLQWHRLSTVPTQCECGGKWRLVQLFAPGRVLRSEQGRKRDRAADSPQPQGQGLLVGLGRLGVVLARVRRSLDDDGVGNSGGVRS